MKVAINGRFLCQSVTGVQRVAREFVKALDKYLDEYKMEVELLVPKNAQLVNWEYEFKNIKIKRVGLGKGHLWEQIVLPFYLRGARLLSLGNTAPLIRNLKANQDVTMIHDLSYRYFPDAYSKSFKVLYGILIPKILQNAKKVVTVSQNEYSSILKCYPELIDDTRLSFCQNGGFSDSLELPKCNEFGERKKDLLYVGSLTKRKNAQGLITLAKNICSKDTSVRFLFVGSNGRSFEDVDLNVPEELKERILFLGQINDEKELVGLYNNCRLFVFPSFYEASPLPPVEAMMLGCPTVTSNISSLVERCGEVSPQFDPEDIEGIAEKAMRIINDEHDWTQLSKQSKSFSEKYTWSKQVEHVMRLFEK
jgi:glycosyltransferase involved in cell wall biosynthesis